MSKAAKIRELYAAGLSDAEIAKAVGTTKSYVRTAARQRPETGISEADKRYWLRRWGGSNWNEAAAKQQRFLVEQRKKYPMDPT